MLDLFIWIVAGLLAAQLLILFCLIFWKARAIGYENKVNESLNSLKPQYIEYIKGERPSEPSLPKSKSMQVMVMERMLDEFYSGNYGDLEERKLNQLAEKYLAAHYRRTLKKGGWAERINALYFIEDFYLLSLREDAYHHFLKLKRQDEEFRQCLRVCASLQEERILPVIVEKEGLSTGFIKELLFRLNEILMWKILEKIENKDDIAENVVFAFITFNGEQKNEPFFSFVEKKIYDERKEVRLKAMNSLCNYGKVSDPLILDPFFASEYWEERMYAAKLAGACYLPQYTQTLLELLSDAVWWVRFAAAENIKNFPDGEALLRQVALWDEDAYSRDIAKHMLTRRGGITA
ncbi:HEAT repeat domain-containing protein [Planomicrobium sp. CPCC 101079]|uniref:HEAT repeat domain-containing protein n=1 Tax=Planomicrobium sp. CPCC 101079 TaxID=2599618 RepID=UPI0011B547B4|nr:HEAT repeat domain-containing protein [Planomicrobium sp. CPCC 101079]TWT00486.1 HEAT repeat domain-containing protein [Planomicrobium sp. CPCC 101079]